jgi:transcription elongation factor GreA
MSADGPKLSAEGRRALQERLVHIAQDRIPRLEREFFDTRDELVATALANTRAEAVMLKSALATASPLEAEPHDPTIVEVGDVVKLREENSTTRERFTLVEELEARMDDSWISVEAPLGAALLGSSVGDLVSVESPGGTLRYEVLAIQRLG